jgi:hypothetical protein
MVKLQKHSSPLLMKLLMKLFFQKTAYIIRSTQFSNLNKPLLLRVQMRATAMADTGSA